jgi:hypothetical protein
MHTTAKRKRLILAAAYLSLVLVMISAVYLASPRYEEDGSDNSLTFPGELGSMNLVDQYSGARARSEILNMHMGDVDFLEGYVAYYAGNSGQSARFWVSTFYNESLAYDATERMTEELSKGGTPFSVPEKVEVSQSGVEYAYHLDGMGQAHYYWQKERIVVWVALTNLSEGEQIVFLNRAIEGIGG